MMHSKEWYSLWRWPKLWLILAVVAFVAGGLFWQMVDRYSSLQLSMSALPNPPTLTEALWQPWLMTLSQLMLLVVAMTAGFSIAQERSQKTLWYLMINRSNYLPVVWQKYLPQGLSLLFFLVLILLSYLLLSLGGQLSPQLVATGCLGMVLLFAWLSALGTWLSSLCQSTGTAVLLNLVVFVSLWAIGGDGVGQSYGLNWLQLLTPVHHFKWLLVGELSVSTLIYFVGGAAVFLWLTAQQLSVLRKSA